MGMTDVGEKADFCQVLENVNPKIGDERPVEPGLSLPNGGRLSVAVGGSPRWNAPKVDAPAAAGRLSQIQK